MHLNFNEVAYEVMGDLKMKENGTMVAVLKGNNDWVYASIISSANGHWYVKDRNGVFLKDAGTLVEAVEFVASHFW